MGVERLLQNTELHRTSALLLAQSAVFTKFECAKF